MIADEQEIVGAATIQPHVNIQKIVKYSPSNGHE